MLRVGLCLLAFSPSNEFVLHLSSPETSNIRISRRLPRGLVYRPGSPRHFHAALPSPFGHVHASHAIILLLMDVPNQ